MRCFLIIAVLFFVQLRVVAQKDTTAVLEAVLKLEKALVSKDTAQLIPLLHKDVAYGHSSGWVQKKKDVINDMLSGFLIYNKIENNSTTIEVSKGKAIVQERISVNGARDGKTFDLALFVMEVWVQNKKGWTLYSRQSTKL
ncbi:MAG: nuclear transport factor 2 family protein [Bacteroidota bacterium]